MDHLLCDSVALDGDAVSCLAGPGASVQWQVHLGWLLAGFAVLSLVHFLRVLRWVPLMRAMGDFDFWTLNRVGAVSFMCVFIFPLRLGEFVRPYLASREGKIRKSAVFGTIAVERVMDGMMMALLLSGVLAVLPSDDAATFYSLRAGALVALAVFSSAMAMLMLAYWRRDLAVRVVHAVFGLVSHRIADKVAAMIDAFIGGMRAMPSRTNGLQFLVATMLYWGVNGFSYFFVMKAFGLDQWVDLAGAYAMMSAVAVGMMIPNSPANVGSFWYFLLLPATLYGVPQDTGTAMAFALFIWALMLLQYALFSGYFLLSGKVSIGALWSTQKDHLPEA